MNKNQEFANLIVRFFRSFKISIPLSIILFIVLFFGIFQVQNAFNPDLSGVGRGNDMVFYGNDFNEKAMDNYRKHFSTSYDGTDSGWKEKVMDSIEYYKSSKTKTSLFICLLVLFGLPILITLIVVINHGAIASKGWIDENKSI